MDLSKHFYLKISFLSVLSGIIAALAWQSKFLFPLQLIGFVPFLGALYLIKASDKSIRNKILLIFLSTFSFRWITLSIGMPWLYEVSLGAMIIISFMDVLILSLLFSFIVIKRLHFIAVVLFFILFEYLLQHFIFLAPFYLIGYAWSNHVSLIQYYSILGVEGGGALIYFVNYAVFNIIKNKKISLFDYSVFGIFIGLTSFSLLSYYLGKDIEWEEKEQVSILHSEIDTMDSLYINNPIVLEDEVQKVVKNNALIILPESFFNRLDWYDFLPQNKTIRYIDSLNTENNQQHLLGAMIYTPTKTPTPQSKVIQGQYYNSHNVSILKEKRIHVKSKQNFIPFLEYVPNNSLAQKINKWIPVVGDSRKISPMGVFDDFQYKGKRFDILLCYGSIFPDLVAKRAENSNFLTVQANENWHKSHKCSYQYFNMNRANTIQSGIPTYRSSNYGYSGFIKPNGDADYLYNTGVKFSALVAPLPKRVKSSFYSKIRGYTYFGSLIGVLALFLGVLMKRGKSSH